MTGEALVSMLEGVKKTGQGWKARCPAHEDRDPSLSVREGDRGILVKCWAGCQLTDICSALGIRVRDLFYDANSHPDWKQVQDRQAKQKQQKAVAHLEGWIIDARREAGRFLESCRGHDASNWNQEKFDDLLDSVCQALEVLREEGEFYGSH